MFGWFVLNQVGMIWLEEAVIWFEVLLCHDSRCSRGGWAGKLHGIKCWPHTCNL